MENENSKHYIELAELLKQNRTDADSAKVDRILASDMPIHNKILEILKIDEKTSETNSYLSRGPSKEISEKEIIKTQYTNVKQSRNHRHYIKNSIKKKNFISFLFQDFFRIINFTKKIGRKDDVLRCTVFPPSITVNRRMTRLFQNSFQKYAEMLTPALDNILKIGWRHLGKKDYNLIVQFSNLCKSILSVDLRIFANRGDNIILKLKNIENSFMICNYNHIYTNKIIEIIPEIASKYPEWKSNPKKLEDASKILLLKNASRPSLYNVLLAFNMAYYKRYLTLTDLFNKENLDIIPDYEYECSNDVCEKIDEYVAKQKEELLSFIAEKNDIEKFEKFIPIDENGNYDTKLLRYYYDKTVVINKKTFIAEKDVIPLLISNIAKVFLRNFENLLYGTVLLENGTTTKIFHPEMFQFETSKLRLFTEKLNKYSYEFKNIDRNRFLSLQSSGKTGTEAEIEIIKIVEEILNIFQTVANRLVEVDRFSVLNPESEITDDKDSDISINAQMITSKKVTIPYKTVVIKAGDLTNGLSVLNAIHDCIKFCLIAAVYLNDSYISRLLKRKSTILREISSRQSNLKRTAKPDEYDELIRKTSLNF